MNEILINNIIKLALDSDCVFIAEKFISTITITDNKNRIQNIINENFIELATSPFGNYLIQFLFLIWKDDDIDRINNIIIDNANYLAKQRYSSNIIEKTIEIFNSKNKAKLIRSLSLGGDILDTIKNQYGHYVINKAVKYMDENLKKEIETVLNSKMPEMTKKEKSKSKKFILNLKNIGKNKNQTYINTINGLNAQINMYKSQLNEEKNKNQSYINTINTINTLNAQLSLVQKQLNEEKNKNQTYINTMNTLNVQLSLVQKQLNDEKNKNKNNFHNMNQQNKNREITYINPGEKIMTINFVSQGNQDITNYSLACKNTDLFVRLEEILYQDYPKFKDYETFFEVRTKRIKRFKTIEENDIRSGDVISVFRIDN